MGGRGGERGTGGGWSRVQGNVEKTLTEREPHGHLWSPEKWRMEGDDIPAKHPKEKKLFLIAVIEPELHCFFNGSKRCILPCPSSGAGSAIVFGYSKSKVIPNIFFAHKGTYSAR